MANEHLTPDQPTAAPETRLFAVEGAVDVTARYADLNPWDRVYEHDGDVIKVKVGQHVDAAGQPIQHAPDMLIYAVAASVCHPDTAKAQPFGWPARPWIIGPALVQIMSHAPEDVAARIEEGRHRILAAALTSLRMHRQAADASGVALFPILRQAPA